jgi:hypothetical protein
LLTFTLFHCSLIHNSPFSTHTFSITARKPWPEALRLVQHFSRSSLRGLLTRCIVTTGKHLLLHRQFIRNFFLHSHTHNYKPTLHANHPTPPNTFIFTIHIHHQGYPNQQTRLSREAWKVQILRTQRLQRAALRKAQRTITCSSGGRSALTAFPYCFNLYLFVLYVSCSWQYVGAVAAAVADGRSALCRRLARTGQRSAVPTITTQVRAFSAL